MDSLVLPSALAWLRGQRAEMERALGALVAVNSFTANPAGGRRVGAMLRELAVDAGLDVEVRTSERFADHLVLATGAQGAPFALVGHLDTVFPPGAFEGMREDGELLRGPGVLDMKGGLVVALFALRALHAAGLADRIPVRLVIVADEEVGSPEGQPILREACAGARAGLVFEAGRANDAIVTRRKGVGSMRAVAHGKAAHAGAVHHEGVNAIWALAKFVDRAQRLTDYARGVTVNVGTLAGGQAKNTVPDRAEAGLDLRFGTAADAEALVAALGEAARASAEDVPGARLELDGGPTRWPQERTEASGALAEGYGACARAEGLGAGEAPLVGGGSDANTLASAGIPSIDGLGPRGAGFHTIEERIERATLVAKAAALARFLASAAG